MSFGIGTPSAVGYGDADSWGGPADGIDVMEGIGEVQQKTSARISPDKYLFVIIVLALVALWVLGAGIFRSARM